MKNNNLVLKCWENREKRRLSSVKVPFGKGILIKSLVSDEIMEPEHINFGCPAVFIYWEIDTEKV